MSRSGAAGAGTAGERLPIVTALNGVASEADGLALLRPGVRGLRLDVGRPPHAGRGDRPKACPTSGHVPHRPGARPSAGPDDHGRWPARGDWTGARLTTPLPADVMAWKYRKLLSNVGNAFQALLGQQPGIIVGWSRPPGAEGRGVLDAAGIAYTSDEDEAGGPGRQLHRPPGARRCRSSLGGSTWQSLPAAPATSRPTT